jgi:hypothetical protein
MRSKRQRTMLSDLDDLKNREETLQNSSQPSEGASKDNRLPASQREEAPVNRYDSHVQLLG